LRHGCWGIDAPACPCPITCYQFCLSGCSFAACGPIQAPPHNWGCRRSTGSMSLWQYSSTKQFTKCFICWLVVLVAGSKSCYEPVSVVKWNI